MDGHGPVSLNKSDELVFYTIVALTPRAVKAAARF